MDSAVDLPPLDVPALLRSYGLQPKKSLGQNFLVDSAALARVAAVAEITPEDAILEIGAGLGSLTRVLARSARRVVAVELDGRLFPVLRSVLAGLSNVELVQGDILEIDPAKLALGPAYLVVANIPYYITSALVRHLLEAAAKPSRLVLTVQREVAERICAQAGEMSLLALSVQVYGRPLIATHIPAGAFYPRPKVDSAVVRVDLYEQPLVPANLLDDFFRLAKAGFAQKRKTLRNSLAAGLAWRTERVDAWLSAAGIDPRRRAETLSVGEWGALAARLAAERA
jgi:16S rRNA (adenine1518-N6/adenine1519-N6)-dimethyltransferase